MATPLQDFRARYPQYNDLDDEELGEALYQRQYSDMDRAEYRRRMGLPPEVEPAAPSMGDRFDQKIDARSRDADPLAENSKSDLKELARDLPPATLEEDDEAPGFFSNSFRLAGERGSTLMGHAISGMVGKPGDFLDEKFPAGSIVFGTDWGAGDPADGKFRVRYMTPQELERREAQGRAPANVMTDTLPDALQNVDLGGEPRYTPDSVKAAYNRGEVLGTAGQVIGYMYETGITSIPDMLAVAGGPAAWTTYTLSRADEIGEERARNMREHNLDPISRHHYESIANDQVLINPDGSHSTVYTMQIDVDGVPTLIPGLWDGKKVGAEEAARRAKESGIEWTTAPTHEELRQIDIAIHDSWKDVDQEGAREILEGEDPTLVHNMQALPAAVATTLFERYGVRQIQKAFGKETAEEIGAELLEAGFKEATKRVGKKAGWAALAEAGTEAFQEGVIEYLGERLKTNAGISLDEAAERAFWGALAGAGFGGTLGAAGAVGTELMPGEGRMDPETGEPMVPMDEAPDTDFDEEGNVIPTPEPEPEPAPEPEPDDVPRGTEPEPEPAPEEPPIPDEPPEVYRDPTEPVEEDGNLVRVAGEDWSVFVDQELESGERDVTVVSPGGDITTTTLLPGETYADAVAAVMGAQPEPEPAPEPITPEIIEGRKSRLEYWQHRVGELQEEIDNLPASASETEYQELAEILEEARTELADAERDVADAEAAVPVRPEGVLGDPRLRREIYRAQLAGMGQDLVVGGDISNVTNDRGEIIHRTPSLNPQWFQDIRHDAQLKMSVKETQNAIAKALDGQKLGVRQARMIEYMLGVIQEEREHPMNVDYARQQLEEARERRRAGRQDAGLPPTDAYEDANAGELFDESEYLPEMDADTRIAYELVVGLQEMGVPQTEIDQVLNTSPSAAAAIIHLEDLRYAFESAIAPDQAGAEIEGEPASETPAAPEPAPEPEAEPEAQPWVDTAANRSKRLAEAVFNWEKSAKDYESSLRDLQAEGFGPQSVAGTFFSQVWPQIIDTEIHSSMIVALEKQGIKTTPEEDIPLNAYDWINSLPDTVDELTGKDQITLIGKMLDGVDELHRIKNEPGATELPPMTPREFDPDQIYYHGTGGQAEWFTFTGDEAENPRAYLAQTPEEAEHYADWNEDSAIIPMKLLTPPWDHRIEENDALIWEFAEESGMAHTRGEAVHHNFIDQFVDFLEVRGIRPDSIFVAEDGPDSILVLNPESVVSAITGRAPMSDQQRMMAVSQELTPEEVEARISSWAKSPSKAWRTAGDLFFTQTYDTLGPSLRGRIQDMMNAAGADMELAGIYTEQDWMDRGVEMTKNPPNPEKMNQPTRELWVMMDMLVAMDEQLAEERKEAEDLVDRDLFGAVPTTEQELADEQRRRDEARDGTQDVPLETGDPGDLFSQAGQQTDIEDEIEPLPGFEKPPALTRDQTRFLNKAVGAFDMDMHGERVVERMEGKNPQAISLRFWEEVYPEIRKENQKMMDRMADNLGAFETHGDTSREAQHLQLPASMEALTEDELEYVTHMQWSIDALAEARNRGVDGGSVQEENPDYDHQQEQLELYLDSEPDPSQAEAPRLREAKAAALNALRNLQSTPSLLAERFSRELAEKRSASLLGRQINNTYDLASIAQIYRDPRFETLRVFLTKDDGTIVGQLGFSSRLPAASAGFVGEQARFMRDLRSTARRVGATNYYLQHNHPSGNPEPSMPDKSMTRNWANELLMGDDPLHFRGHVIINHNKYGVIDEHQNVSVESAPQFQGIDFHPTGPITEVKLEGPMPLMELARQMELTNDVVVAIVTDHQFKVRHLDVIPGAYIRRSLASARYHLRRAILGPEHGGSQVFAVSRHKGLLRRLEGMVVDAVHLTEEGRAMSLADNGIIQAGGDVFPRFRAPIVTPDTSTEFEYLRSIAMQERRYYAKREKSFRDKRYSEGWLKEDGPEYRTDRRSSPRPGAPERRVDADRRRRIEGMTPEEIVQELYTDELTGLGNRRAFNEEAGDAAVIASVDVDGLGGVNDHLGHDAGDAMLQAVGHALSRTGLDAFHISGDEFYLVGDSMEQVAEALEQVERDLAIQVLETSDGRLNGINITHGAGETKAAADRRMERAKKQREAAGLRSPKGQLPPGGVLNVGTTLNSTAGGSHKPIIGQFGNLPLTPEKDYQLGNGRVVQIPDKTVRRKDIMALLQRRFGNKIYQGRVKGKKTRLGFYRPGHGEIRIRNQNDLEVTAHEVAHWLDDRHPWISALYKQHREEMKAVSYDDKLDFEGYAEFMRHWFTQEHIARETAPGFYDAWMNALESHPGLREISFDLQEAMHAWYLQGALKRLDDRSGKSDVSLMDRARNIQQRAGDRLLQKVLDGLRPFKEAERTVRGYVGDARHSGYASFRLARGINGMSRAMMQRGTFNWDENGDIVFTGKSLEDVFAPVSDRMDEMQNYMVARRAAELMAQGRENHVRMDEIVAGLAMAGQRHIPYADGTVDIVFDSEIDGDPIFDTVFNEWLAFNRRMMDFYEASGIVSEKTREAIETMNQNYVPFNRIVDTLMGEKPRGRGKKLLPRLYGGTGNINDVFESIVGNHTHMIHVALINNGKANFYRMLDSADNQTAALYAAPIGKDTKATRIDQEQVLKTVIEGLGLTMKWWRQAKTGMVTSDQEAQLVAELTMLTENLEPMVTFFQFGMDPRGDVDFYYQDGNKKFYEIIDPYLMDAITQLGPKPHNLMLNMLGGFANILRRGVTITPQFQMKNFIRDTMNAFTLSKGKIVPAAAASKALVERIWTDEHYWEYMVNGGGFASMADADGINRERVLDSGRKIWETFDRGLASFEYANRIAEFKTLRDKGWSARDAALAGREISSDFAMRGSSETIRWLTTSIPFLNARLQGLYRNARELAQLEGGGRIKLMGGQSFSYALRSMISITAPTIALFLMNKDDERFQEIPDWIRDLSWIVFTGEGEDDYVMIPKPFETGMLWGTLPERMLEYYYTNNEQELAEALSWMMLQTFDLASVPQAFQPWYDLARNKKFTGAPIIPEYLEDVEPMEQYKFYTSDAMIALGRELGISPIKAEYLVRGHFGTWGIWGLGLADFLVGDINNSGEAPTKTWRSNMLLKPFVNDGPLRRTHSENHLYDMLKETREVANTVRTITNRSPERIEQYLSQPKKQAYMAMNEGLNDWAKAAREIRNAMLQISTDPDMPGDEKRRAIAALQRSLNQISREVYQANNPETVQAIIDDIERAEGPRARAQ